MSNFSWWRSWHGAPMDHKWSVVAARAGTRPGIVSAVAWAMLDYASQNDPRGSVIGFDEEEYSIFSGFSIDEIHSVILAMEAKSIIVEGRFTAWEKRQPKREDDSAERVRKFRESKRNVTQCNAEKQNETIDSLSLSLSESESVNRIDSLNKKPDIFEVYEKEIGIITPAISEKLKAAESEYPGEWLPMVIEIAADKNKRSWAYCEAILKSWKIHGVSNGKKPTATGTQYIGPHGEVMTL